jgi:hypothetical protein
LPEHNKQWDVSEMDVETLYHPVKDINLHGFYRKRLAGNDLIIAAPANVGPISLDG